MVHVTDDVYRDLERCIEEGFDGFWMYGDFMANVKSTVEYVKEYTGVEFYGEKEVYFASKVVSWDVEDFCHKEEEETDFDITKIEI
jgi:hypothetical protein